MKRKDKELIRFAAGITMAALAAWVNFDPRWTFDQKLRMSASIFVGGAAITSYITEG